ncbi:polar amino acid transport system ATP-binding protein [Bifidobacterium commune]|uniref:Amino acid ABC transporter ATP-binding protein, PAAT family (TC 3.A.1.3.-) n=1 Tax=Bifidobacterium commune TaxID=1505727 RepID=A0A1C4H297_9BIFI|nr:amino acid ABC transporter ATP-binding protein [Bifidobacterium commune]MBB2954888.1 polar amino acid transport system ATP-binding protein [Bifidobacterium commune]SCC78985.1 amino acid ABC transporter ATP-binding protein, PAAT family (TC 3.A.1.3.-) [Bifidobacterium commune]
MTEALNTVDTDSQDNALHLRHVTKLYEKADKPVLNDISFDVLAGQVLVILGPSGSGKSTLLRTIAGLEPIQGGDISIGRDVLRASDKGHTSQSKPSDNSLSKPLSSNAHDIKVGMVFQSYDLFPNKTVIGNIMLAPVLVQKRKKQEAKAEAIQLLERVGLADRQDAWPHELSGGQRQRVAICRALIEHPQIMLFDEVTAALDPEMVREVLDVIVELADSGQTMLIVTHEMAFARAIADRIILLENGSIVEESNNAEAFFTNPQSPRAKRFLSTFTYSRERQN